ncbi:hypothetical protein Ddc_21864 [Ditylenchus destructor]|nr:hypothetical protein Ddc_21864 [Ditylenchus destructor]
MYSMNVCTSQGPATIRVTSITSRRGKKLKVCSLIWVAAWNIATSRPTNRLGTTSTATITVVSHSASRNRSTATSGVIALYPAETAGQGADNQRPAVHQHKQHDLERQRNDQWRQHHHTHGHQHARHHQVDDQERDEDHETDLECGLQFRRDERRHQDRQRRLIRRSDVGPLGQAHEQFKVAGAGLRQHKVLDRALGLVDCVLGGHFFRQVRLQGLLVHLVEHRRHDEQRQEQGHAGEDLVRRRLLQAQGLAQDREHDDDPREAGHQHDERRDKAQRRHDQQDLQADRVFLRAGRVGPQRNRRDRQRVGAKRQWRRQQQHERQ